MPNLNYQRGRRLEWQVKKDLEAEGWNVMRTAGSHGVFDLIAIRYKNDYVEMRFIQCKSMTKKTNLDTLIKEIYEKSPIPYSFTAEGSCLSTSVSMELIVKQHGVKEYTVYPLES